MSLIESMTGILAKAPPALVRVVVALVKDILTAEDPMRTAKRASAAAAAEIASDAAIRKAMAARAKGRQ